MKNSPFPFLISIGLLVLIGCQSPSSDGVASPLMEVLSPERTGILFENRLPESPSQNVLSYEYYYNGAGLAIADFNQDGAADIYFVSNLKENQLYLNEGGMQFREVGKMAGLSGKRGFSTGVSTVDINSDGLMDIYVCKSGRYTNPDARRNELFINQGPNEQGIPVFVESARNYGLDLSAYSTQASFFDYDKDGDLDMFLINHDIDTYAQDSIARRKGESSSNVGDRLFQNQDGRFVDVSTDAGLINNRLGFGLGVGVGDFNKDTWPDVYVSTDYSGSDHLYINQRDGTFKEQIRELTPHTSFYSMGNDVGDINNDGWMDIINLDMVAEDNYGIKTSMSAMNPAQFENIVDLGLHHQYMYNTMLLNQGNAGADGLPYFSDIGQLAGISSTGWSWAPLLFDFNNDGNKDLFISNGIKRNIRNNDAVKAIAKIRPLVAQARSPQERASYIEQMLTLFPYHRKPNYFFLNKGDLSFDNITSQLGMDSLFTASNGAAYGDLDGDGDLDLVINNVDQPAMVIRNNSQENGQGNYLKVRITGPDKNSFGIGAQVSVRQKGGQVYTSEVYTTRGYMSAVEPHIHVGLASAEEIEEVEIIWPDGTLSREQSIQPNQTLEFSYSESETEDKVDSHSLTTLFEDITIETDWTHKHKENTFDDYARESLLPHKMSQMGPAIAIADVNQDGLEDVFIGGSLGNTATLYIQKENGRMVPSQVSLWKEENDFEDAAAIFLDADGDGDKDLIVGSGGNEYPAGHPSYALRLYENTGQGIFRKNTSTLDIIESVGVLSAQDIDQDGDLDLFVGGRQVPGRYPFSANSYVLINESSDANISFIDGTKDWAPYLEEFGMVTDASWADVNQDTYPDLLIVGEWMTPRLLLNDGKSLVDQTESSLLADYSGWWFSLAVGDFDNDGDIDFMAGNLGLNYKYKASVEEPFAVFADDFDANGSMDIVLSYHQKGTQFPLRGRECSSNQMPFIKTKFPSYDAFGKASLIDVFGSQELTGALKKEANTFASTYFENNGAGVFTAHPLPIPAQLSSVNAILVADFDGDESLDALVAGNLYGSEVETPRNDGSIGCLLKGDGRGSFQVVPAVNSGVKLLGEVKQMEFFYWNPSKKPVVLAVKNPGDLQILSY